MDVPSKLGNGSEFKVFLPVVSSHSGSAKAPDPKPVEYQQGTETMMFLEDEEFIPHMGVESFRDSGYHVIAAQSGPEIDTPSMLHY